MKITFNIRKSHFYVLAALIVLAVGVAGVTAYRSGAAPSEFGHSGEEIEVTLSDGTAMTLQDAIDTGRILGTQEETVLYDEPVYAGGLYATNKMITFDSATFPVLDPSATEVLVIVKNYGNTGDCYGRVDIKMGGERIQVADNHGGLTFHTVWLPINQINQYEFIPGFYKCQYGIGILGHKSIVPR